MHVVCECVGCVWCVCLYRHMQYTLILSPSITIAALATIAIITYYLANLHITTCMSVLLGHVHVVFVTEQGREWKLVLVTAIELAV